MTALVKYDAACKALAVAKSVDEVKDIRDKATAMKAYARQAQNKQLEIDASEIRIRAERRLGEMLAESPKHPGSRGQLKGKDSSGRAIEEPPESNAVRHAEAGIDKKLAARAQQYASIPKKEFETILAERRERIEQENERVSVQLHVAAKKHKPTATFDGEDDEDISESFTSSDPNDAYLAFLMRVDNSCKFARDAEFLFSHTSKRKHGEILQSAKSVVAAWSSVVSKMEN